MTGRIDERLQAMGVDASEMTDEQKFTAATGLTRYTEYEANNPWYVPGGAANVPAGAAEPTGEGGNTGGNTSTTEPAGPTSTTEPAGPTGNTDTTEPAESTSTTEPAGPTSTTEPAGPTSTTEPAGPTGEDTTGEQGTGSTGEVIVETGENGSTGGDTGYDGNDAGDGLDKD